MQSIHNDGSSSREQCSPNALAEGPPIVPISPLTHVAILTAILLPTAVLPYLAVRRHLLSLRRKLAEVGVANTSLQRDLKTALLESSIRREEHDRLKLMIDEVRRDLKKFRIEESRKELVRARQEERTRRDLEEFTAEQSKTRAGLSHLRDLSSSLADIAAFMHEVEVQQGFVSRKNDGRGIERIRQLAYRLQGMSVDKQDTPESEEPKFNTRTQD